MTLRNHRRLLGGLLVASAAVSIAIAFGMFGAIPFDEFQRGAPPGLVWIIYAAICFSLLLYLFQAFMGYKVFRNGPKAKAWGIFGSVLALIGGITLPVGAYGVWLTVARSHEDAEMDPSKSATNNE